MKTKLFIAISFASLVCGSAILSSCGERVYYERPGYPTSYSTGVLDAFGFPIFGYQNGRAVYAFTPNGAPVYNRALIKRNYYVPRWEPSTEYNGKYYYPKSVRRVDSLPHTGNGWAVPAFDRDKPSIVKPTVKDPYKGWRKRHS